MNPSPPETGPVIEQAYLDLKPGGGDIYISKWPAFREILMSLEGAVSCRLLRNHAKPESFICCMEWVSKEAKAVFAADPRLPKWAEDFFTLVDNEVIEYYEEVG